MSDSDDCDVDYNYNESENKNKLKKSAEKVEFNDLLTTIKSTRNVDELKKKFTHRPVIATEKEDYKTEKTKKEAKLPKKKNTKLLDPPLHRQAKQRIESEIVYNDIKRDLCSWNSIVHKNRVAEQICFPLGSENLTNFSRIQTAAEKAQEFEPRTELERLTAEVLGKSKYNVTNEDKYSEAEKELIKAMNIKEARNKCEKLQKLRALMSYKAVKMKREAKIKSKQYHRIRKREERRKVIKEIETLIVKDPEAVKEKLKDLEKDRVLERATLKHRSANKWSRQVRQFASRNPALRKIVDEHFRLGGELKAHTDLDKLVNDDETNDGEEKKPLTIGNIIEAAASEANQTSSVEPTQIISAQNPFMKSALEAIRKEREILLENARNKGANANPSTDDLKNKPLDKPLILESRQLINLPEELTNDNDEHTAEMQENFLAEAYGDDDILGEFVEEKMRVEEEENPKPIETNLFGWGSWTGPGITDKKKTKFITNNKKLKRKDANRPNLIIREKISKGIAELQPCDVPFPFTSIEDYELYIKQPLGRDWNSEISQKSLVKPRIVTEAGRIIRPMDKHKKEFVESDSDY